MIQITFASNYINHHQLPFCEALLNTPDIDFTFIQTEPMEKERSGMGWDERLSDLPFVKKYYEDSFLCQKLLMESDIVIFGACKDEEIIIPRLENRKPVFRYSERIYKEGQWKFISPRGLKKKYHDHIRFNSFPVYLLCAGAYVASDFSLIHAYTGKMLRWGYFPEFIQYSEDDILSHKAKSTDKPKILWVGRQIPLKHPENPILAAETLKKEGLDFSMTIVGDGELHDSLTAAVEEKNLTDCISFEDFKSPSEIRSLMLEYDIFLFTSNYIEGWGAVLNESMNAGCAVISSSAVGGAAFLISHQNNGMVYKYNDVNELTSCIRYLIENPQERINMGLEAYRTISEKWNANEAARRLVSMIRGLLNEKESVFEPFDDDGPLSLSPIISPHNGYKYTHKQNK